MEWFTGDVGSAITLAKSKNAIFCVYITGQDDMSVKLLEMTQTTDFSEKYKDIVCIKIEQGTTTFSQFSQIYPVLMVPSIYYINSATGVDIEVTVTTGDVQSVLAGLDRAVDKFNDSSAAPSQVASTSEAAKPAADKQESEDAKPSTSVESQDVGARVSRARELLDENVGNVGPVQGHDTPTRLEDRVSRAKDFIQQRQEEKSKEEEEKEKSKEIERRNLGRDVQEFQRKQEEQKIQEMVKERQKEKEEERQARARVQAQIEQDRADRAARFKKEKDEREEQRKEAERKTLAEQAAKADRDAAQRSTISRLQFRLPDGRSRTHEFSADSSLDEVYKWVSTDLEAGFSRFTLSTTFPRRNLDDSPRSSTLRDLQLAPSGTVMVLPVASSSSALMANDGSLMSLLMLLMTPFTFLWGLVSSFINPPPSRGPSGNGVASGGSAGQTLGGSTQTDRNTNRPKRGENMGRISNLHEQSDDDEQNTYNGNSTQQM